MLSVEPFTNRIMTRHEDIRSRTAGTMDFSILHTQSIGDIRYWPLLCLQCYYYVLNILCGELDAVSTIVTNRVTQALRPVIKSIHSFTAYRDNSTCLVTLVLSRVRFQPKIWLNIIKTCICELCFVLFGLV